MITKPMKTLELHYPMMTQWYSFMLPVVRLKVSHIWRDAWIMYCCYRDAGLKSQIRSEGSEDEDIQNIARINCLVFELFYTCKVQWKGVSKHKVREPANKPWYIFAEVRTYLNYFIVTTTRGTFKTVVRGQTNLRLQTTYCRTLHGSDTNLKRYLRPCKRFETGLMLFDTEVHKIVIIQTGRYKGSFLGIHRAQSIIELNRTRSVGWIRLSPAIKQNRRPNLLQSTGFVQVSMATNSVEHYPMDCIWWRFSLHEERSCCVLWLLAWLL